MVSRTALKIARVIAQAGSDARLSKLLPPGASKATAELLSACGFLPDWMRALLAGPGFRRLAGDLERAASPGVTLHMVLRKRFFDDQVRAALAEGASQCLVLGAGFDTLSLRLSRDHADTLFVEIDHPATQARKATGVASLGGPSPNLRLLGVDLGLTPLAEALAAVREWDPAGKSVVVAEGLLMYLAEREVEALLLSVAAVVGGGSRVLFSYVEPDAKGRPHIGGASWITRLSLRLLGEPLRWAVPGPDLEGWLETVGFELEWAPRALDLRRLYLDPAGIGDLALSEIEGLAVARWSECQRSKCQRSGSQRSGSRQPGNQWSGAERVGDRPRVSGGEGEAV